MRRALPITALLALAVAGCETNFEDPSIVLDLRMLAAYTEPA